jgi:allantoin racemase
MKIWFQKHTVEGRLPGLDRAYREHVARIARQTTEVDFYSLPAETYDSPLPERYVRHGSIESLFAHYFAVQAVVAESRGYDAYVIGTSQDPGLTAARAFVDLPVLAYGETAAHIAAMLGRRFAFVGFIEELADPISSNMWDYGLAGRMGPFAYVDAGPESVEAALDGHPGAFIESFTQAAKRAIDGGADVIIPGEGLPNEILYAQGITEMDGVPIIDADGLLIKMAELLVELESLNIAGKASRGYWNSRPSRENLEHLLRLFGPRCLPTDPSG